MRNSILVLDYLLEAMEMDGKQSTTDLKNWYWTPKWMDNYQNLRKITMNSHKILIFKKVLILMVVMIN